MIVVVLCFRFLSEDQRLRNFKVTESDRREKGLQSDGVEHLLFGTYLRLLVTSKRFAINY